LIRVLFVLLVLLLAGCATAPPAPPPVRPAQIQHASFTLNGRIAVLYDGKHSSAGVHWQHDLQSDEILLLAPLGQTVARVSRTAKFDDRQTSLQVYTLDTDNRHYAAPDAESLTEKALGWRLPLAGLQYWVLGLPMPGAPFDGQRNESGEWGVLHQDGWTIRYTRYAAQSADSLPQRMELQREGLEIRLLIDEWQIK
jgi:outer membrane lipoprotein LolB